MTETVQSPAAAVLSDVHRAYLNDHAVSDEVIAAQGIRSEGDDIVFTWREGERVTEQRRPWPGESGMYFWVSGKKLHLNILRDPGPDAPVLMTEGTKQSLAVASWAPPEYAVYGMPGCYGWVSKGDMDLSRFAGRQVLIMLDADAADNLDVWEAGTRLAHELSLEEPPAQALFVPSPAWGKDGIDDYLGRIAVSRRADRLAKLIADAQPKPADRKPSRRKVPEEVPDTGELPLVIVNGDRARVIHEIMGHMQARWAGQQLFSYGGAMTRLRGHSTEPLDRDSFANWLIETVVPYKYKPPGASSPGQYEAAWPDPQTMGALLARGDEFPELDRISRTPFARADGSVCAKNGYDGKREDNPHGTGTMLITGNSGMDRLDIPDQPSAADAGLAARYLLDDWLGDFSFRDDASAANALALLLTPFIRGLVPLVPLAVVSGLQMGVGKNLMADCISRVVSGDDITPLPWIPDDDEENAKKIHSAFRAGTSLMCFDEAHDIGGASLTRAITAVTYSDRILGVTKMASYPNRVTWIALGNQVDVQADMSRRVYFIELYPEGPDPQDRDESSFTHPDLRTWTSGARPELVTAALVIIRAWFAAGKPAHPRGSLMGSFEPWDKMISGMLGHAGVDGFLDNLTARRAERDTTGGFWTEHLAWLWSQFSSSAFTTLDVKTKAMASGGTWEAPPRLEEPATTTFPRDLGTAYRKVQDRWFGHHRIVRGDGTSHRKVATWYVEEGLGGTGGSKKKPAQLPTDQVGGTGGTNYLTESGYPESQGVGGSLDQGLPELGKCETLPGTDFTHGDQNAPDLGKYQQTEGVGGSGGTSIPQVVRARAGAHAHTRTHEGGGSGSPPTPSNSLRLVVRADLETGDASRLFLVPRGAALEDGGFIRLAGVLGPNGDPLILPVPDAVALLEMAERIDGHNFLGFDGLALAWHHGMDWNKLAPKIRDTELIDRQVNPPRSRESGTSTDKYDLDHVAAKLGLPGKTDDLARLKREHGGYGAIPVDDPEYRAYLEGDLRATAAVSDRLMPYYDTDPYIRREHAVAAIAGRMSLNGFHVDQDLLADRVAKVDQAKADAITALHDGWGLPLGKTVMKGRGKDKHEEEEIFKSPIGSGPGKAWLEDVFARAGITDPPRTPKDQGIATGADALRPIMTDERCSASLRQMLGLMEIVTGARTVYQTADDWLCPDGRVHPKVSMRQASGRWSFTKPGLTVYGKHDGRHVERDIFLPDPGEVLVSFDLSQVDMRAIAGHCQDPAYMALFAPGRDVHTEIAVRVFGDPARRQDAKARGHGWNYGMGPERMIRDGVDPEMAYAFDNGMKDGFPGLISWREIIRAMGEQGQILYNGFGRRMRCDPRWAYTVAPALMGQGGARDIMCECLLRLPAWTWPMLRAMVHDEVILSVPPEALRDVVRAVTEAMTWTWVPPGAALGVPILCDINGPGMSWGEISGKCQDCGKGTHGPGFCGLYAEMKGLAARYEAVS